MTDVSVMPLAAAMTSTVVPCWAAIDARVSPAPTVWVEPGARRGRRAEVSPLPPPPESAGRS